MTQEEFMARLAEIKVCPVVVIDDVEDAVPLAKALEAGKLPMAEVTSEHLQLPMLSPVSPRSARM